MLLHISHANKDHKIFASRPFGLDQSVRATHLILAGPGTLLFRQYRQKVHDSH